MTKKENHVLIYITKGALGVHAGVYHDERCWAAHPTDAGTAAWRAAVKFWFGKGANYAWTYANVARVTVKPHSENTWQADLCPFTPNVPAAKKTAPVKTKPIKKSRELARRKGKS